MYTMLQSHIYMLASFVDLVFLKIYEFLRQMYNIFNESLSLELCAQK